MTSYSIVMMLMLEGYSHQSATEQKHKHKISRSPAEWSFLQHPTVSICEDHVEQKIKADGPEEHKVCHQPP